VFFDVDGTRVPEAVAAAGARLRGRGRPGWADVVVPDAAAGPVGPVGAGPVVVAEQGRQGWGEGEADDGGVEQDGSGQAEAEIVIAIPGRL
jgi:hypothetical protein